jgi:hypothetical protein
MSTTATLSMLVLAAAVGAGACGRVGLEPGDDGMSDAGSRPGDAGGKTPCSGLDQTGCAARADCRADYCGGNSLCGGPSFVRCSATTDPAPACPAAPCIAVCSQLTTQALCEQRADCHPVFYDFSAVCDCAFGEAGCCTGFLRCADGGKAQCMGTVTCHRAAPVCATLGYVVSYANQCFEGCVRPDECAP